MNIITVKVNGIEYNLKGEEKEEYLHKIGSYVDKKVKIILEKNKKLSTSSAAILTAINIADELFKCDEYAEELENKVKDLADDSSKGDNKNIEQLKEELRIMQEETLKYKEEAEKLKLDNKEIKFNLQTSKYKIIELENKLIDNQIELAKTKKDHKNVNTNSKKTASKV